MRAEFSQGREENTNIINLMSVEIKSQSSTCPGWNYSSDLYKACHCVQRRALFGVNRL